MFKSAVSILFAIVFSISVSLSAAEYNPEPQLDFLQKTDAEYQVFLQETGFSTETPYNSLANPYYAYRHALEIFRQEYNMGKYKSIALQSALKFLVGADVYGDSVWGKKKIDSYMENKGEIGSVNEALHKLLEVEYQDGKKNIVEGYSAFILISSTPIDGWYYAYFDDNDHFYIESLPDDIVTAICESWGGLNESILIAALFALDQYDTGE